MEKDRANDWIKIKGKSISASCFLSLLRTGRPIKLRSCHIAKDSPEDCVHLESFSVQEALDCEACTFHSRVEAKDARFNKTLTLRKCRFKRSLTLRGAKIGGTFDISRSTISAPSLKDEVRGQRYDDDLAKRRQENAYEPPPDWRSAKWNGLQVEGDLVAWLLVVDESINLGGAVIDGTLFLQGSKIGTNEETGGRLYMRQIRVDGDVEMGPYLPSTHSRLPPTHSRRPHEPRKGWIFRTIVYGSVAIGSSVIKGRLYLRGAKFHGCLHAIMIRVTGRILADCWFHPADAKGEHAIRTEVGTLRPLPNGPEDPEVAKCISMYFQDSMVESAVWLRGIETKGGINFENAYIGGALSLDVWHRHSFDDGTHLEDCLPIGPSKMQGLDDKSWDRLLKKQHDAEKKFDLFQTRLGKTDDGYSLNVRNAQIKANLDLRGIHTRGRVLAHNATIVGVLHCEPFQLRGSLKYVRTYLGVNDDNKSLSLYGAKIGINVELSGTKCEGAVRMRYVTLEGGAVSAQRWEPQGLPTSIPEHTIKDLPVTEIGRSEKGHGFYLYGAQIQGNVCCRGIKIEGCLSLELAKVIGSVEFQECLIGYGQNDASTNLTAIPEAGVLLQRAIIANDVNFEGRINSPSTIYMGINAVGVEVGGDLKMKDLMLVSKENQEGAKHPQKSQGKNERRNRLKGNFILAGAKIGGNLDAHGINVANEFNAKGLKVNASVVLTNAKIGTTQFRHQDDPDMLAFNNVTVGQNLELAKTERKSPSVAVDSAEVFGTANFSKISVSGKLTVSPKMDGKLQLDSSNIHNLELHVNPNWPKQAAELDLEHANVEKLDFKGQFPSARKRELKLEGLVFKHLDVEHFQGIAGDFERGIRRPRFLFGALGVLSLLFFGALICCLMFGISSLEKAWQLICLLAGISSPENALHWQRDWELAFWIAYGLISLVLCLVFFGRSFHIARHFRSLGSRSRLLCDWDFVKREQRSLSFLLRLWDFFTQSLPFFPETVAKAKRKSKAWRCRILLAHNNFSTAPYMAVRAMLENQGEREEAADVYFGMRERELIEGSNNWMIKFFKWIFFIAAGSGVRVWPLVTFLILFFIFSWLAVFSNPDSVEHPSTFVTSSNHDPRQQGEDEKLWSERTGRPAGPTWQDLEKLAYGESAAMSKEEVHLDKKGHDEMHEAAEPKWEYTDGFWMAVKVHVPLLHIWAKEKWEPAAIPGFYRSMLGMRPLPLGMEYETYAAIVQIVSYLAIPMLISAIAGFYKGHEHGGAHEHGNNHKHSH